MPKPQSLFGDQTASWVSALEHLLEVLPSAQYVFTEHFLPSCELITFLTPEPAVAGNLESSWMLCSFHHPRQSSSVLSLHQDLGPQDPAQFLAQDRLAKIHDE